MTFKSIDMAMQAGVHPYVVALALIPVHLLLANAGYGGMKSDLEMCKWKS